MTAWTWQLGQDKWDKKTMVGRLIQGSLDKTAVIGESGHDGRESLVWAVQPGQDRENRLARTRIGLLGQIKQINRDKEAVGQPGQNNRVRETEASGTPQPGQNNRNRRARTEQLRKDSWNRKAGIDQLGQESPAR
jgi:hypothetical protein